MNQLTRQTILCSPSEDVEPASGPDGADTPAVGQAVMTPMSEPPSQADLAEWAAELVAIHAGWLRSPNPSVADAGAYLRALRGWETRHWGGSPPEEEPEIQTP